MPAILLVEDNDGLARIYSKYLTTNGYDVRWVTHGTQALSMLNDVRPDLIIVDLVLPGEINDGLILSRRIRTLGYDGPIIAISGEIDLTETEKAEFAATMEKPLRLRELLVVANVATKQSAECC